MRAGPPPDPARRGACQPSLLPLPPRPPARRCAEPRRRDGFSTSIDAVLEPPRGRSIRALRSPRGAECSVWAFGARNLGARRRRRWRCDRRRWRITRRRGHHDDRSRLPNAGRARVRFVRSVRRCLPAFVACDISTKRCVAPLRAGDGCMLTGAVCATGLLCQSGVCVAPTSRLGEPCAGACAEGVCGFSGLCEPRHLPALGEACFTTGSGGPTCTAGAYRQSTSATGDGVCAPLKSVGDVCVSDEECGRGRYCTKSDRFRCSDARRACGG
jgi:hypothetical protein